MNAGLRRHDEPFCRSGEAVSGFLDECLEDGAVADVVDQFG